MNYKQKALDHVRSVCPELEKDTGIEDFHEVVYSWHTPHLEHWLRGLKSAEKDSDYDWWGIDVVGRFIKIDEYNPNGSVSLTQHDYNLAKDGENQDSSFYEAYCSIVGLTTT
jgi:hypothetical protein